MAIYSSKEAEMKIGKYIFISCMVFMALLIILPNSYAQYPIKAKAPLEKKKLAPIVDNPQIIEFSIEPDRVIKGKDILLRWKVEPGAGGSPITKVSIKRTEGIGPDIYIGNNELNGEKKINIPSNNREGRIVYALTVINQVGNSNVKTSTLQVMPAPDIVTGEINAERINLAIDSPDKYYAIYFDVRNIGGDFVGKFTITASVNGSTVPIAKSRGAFNQATVPMVVDYYTHYDYPFTQGKTERFYLRGEGVANGWIGGKTYSCYIQISTDNPDEYTRNNTKQAVLDLEK